jgi:tRNA modification GTPase
VSLDTIIAISTPPGFGGLGIVRLSGPGALGAAMRIFRAPGLKKGRAPVRRAVLGRLMDPGNGRVFDEAVLTYFKAPHSYTREDVVELSCHGSPVILEEVVRLGVLEGARPAHPGEFTLRAFLNGRLDIIQAEAVNDLVGAASLTQARLSFGQLSGGLSKRIARMREGLIRVAAQVEAGLEFPEEGLRISKARHLRALAGISREAGALVESYEAGRALSEGITLAITGKTNVGKSTLFNALLEEERAIVTPYPGTTRDYLRERIIIGDVVFHLVDMAGLGRPSHPVERTGMLRGQAIARRANGLIIVLDGSRKAGPEDVRMLGRFAGKRTIIVVNKSDLPARLDTERVLRLAGERPLVRVSALKGKGMSRLREEIVRTFVPKAGLKGEVILHGRQKALLASAKTAVDDAAKCVSEGLGDELAAEELRKALSFMGQLTGEIRTQDVLDDLFGRFCVGK